MEIKRITDMQEVFKCMPFETEIRRKGRDSTRIQKLILFLQSVIESPLLGYWIAYDDNKNIIGYFVAIVSLVPGMEAVNLLRIYAKQKDIKDKLIEIGTEWAKEFGIKKVQMTAEKHIKAFVRGYKFKVVSVNLERRL